MKTMKKFMFAALGAAMLVPVSASAQDQFEVHGKADFVSNYVWRGFDQNSGFSVQPSLTLGYKGLFLNAWGSESLTNSDGAREFDVNLGYTIGGFTATLTDYWWGGKHAAYGYYNGYDNSVDKGHHFEATLAYTVCEKFPLTLSWSTWLAGADAKNSDGDRCYSSYVNVSYPVNVPLGVTLTPAFGFTPWNGYYSQSACSDKICVTDISLKASKDVKVNKNFSIPVYVQAVVNPTNNKDNTFLVAGFSLGF